MSKFFKDVLCDINGTPIPMGNGVPAAPTSASVTNTSSLVIAANASREGLVVMNLGTVNVSFGCGYPAVVNSGITITPNGVWVMDAFTFTTGAINAICSSTATLAIQEYV